MNYDSTEMQHQAIRQSLLKGPVLEESTIKKSSAARVIAAISCCKQCEQWWVSSDRDSPETRFIWRYVEPYSGKYLWQDYVGWYRGSNAADCPTCGQDTGEAECVLRFDKDGEIVWPEVEERTEENPVHESGNPFISYVAQSKTMDDNISVIAAWEERHKSNAWGYTADINDVRDEMAKMRTAFKDAVYSYAPLLPPGWRVTGDYDKWVKGESCAGFLHGEIRPDISLLIGGRCSTVAELEMELDRLYRYVCELS